MKTADILNKIKQIKKNGLNNNCYISNSYYNFALADKDKEWEAYEGKHSLLVVLHEYKVNRLLFYSSNEQDLADLSRTIQGTYTLDIVSKDRMLYSALLHEMGFEQLTEMWRVANTDITSALHAMSDKYTGCDISYDAVLPDIDDIYHLLWETFDTRIGHLPSKRQLETFILNDEFRIIRDDRSKLVTLIQAKIEPKKYYVNQIINHGNKELFHACICSSLKKYCEHGGKYAYAWVEHSNIASLKFFEKYGLAPDGLYTCVYVK